MKLALSLPVKSIAPVPSLAVVVSVSTSALAASA